MTALLPGETITGINDGLRLIQNPAGLSFGTDALLLAAFVRRDPARTALEYGSGSGAVTMLLAARRKFALTVALEIQPAYADLTRRNLELNGLGEAAEAVCCDVRTYRRTCDAVVTNPPYLKTGAGRRNRDDGRYAARHEVNGTVLDFCLSAARNLTFGGLFYAVYRPDRSVDLLAAMRETGLEPKRICFVHPDVSHSPCLFLTVGKKGANPGCEVMKPLFLTGPDGAPTPEATRLTQTGEWPY